MPPKGKGKKKTAGGGKKATPQTKQQDDDWAALAEFEQDQPALPPPEEGADAAAAAADTAAAAEPTAVEEPTADAAGGDDAAPPAAPAQNAAAAFLAQMGVAEEPAGEGGGGGNKKKKDKKKNKGKPKKEATDGDKEEKAPKMTAQGRMLAERMAKQRAEEERIRKEQEEEEARIAEEERKAKEELDRVEEEKARKREKKRLKMEQAKKDGTYKTKAQKEKERLAQERLEAMKASGMFREPTPGGSAAVEKKKRPTYGSKRHNKNKPPPTKAHDESPEPPPAPPGADAEEEEAVVALDGAAAAEPEGAADAPAGGEGDGQQEEEAADSSWEDVADNWEDAEEPVLDLGPAVPEEDEEEEDLAEREREEERKAAKARAVARAKREEEKAREDAERAELEKEAEIAEETSKADREAELRKLEARKRRMDREAAEAADRSTERLRSPICCIMGHVDTGKTKLLDKIRRTNVQEGEAGGITQQIGATFFPPDVLGAKTDKLNAQAEIEMRLPGLLVIDTPGHEAFANLRSRGSSLCDIAILVVDLMHGLEPQTIESIGMLRKKRCPFVVALNKVDRLYDWKTVPDLEIQEALALQTDATRSEFMDRMRGVRLQLNEQGLNAELYWENTELATCVSMIPTSAISGEGVNDLLHMLVRLTQQRLAQTLMFSATLQCTVLEVKVIDGLGCTVDVILVNGALQTGSTIVVCTTNGPVATQVRALLTPPPSREMRVKAQYLNHDCIEAAIGVKICATGLEQAVAGSPVMVLGPEDDLEDIQEEVMKDFAALASNLTTDADGVFAQASTLGALEALLEFLRHECDPPIPVHGVAIGPIFKKEVLRAGLMHQKKKPEYATILAFDVPIDNEARLLADELNVSIFTADIIYHLFDQFQTHLNATMEQEKIKAKEVAVFPCLLRILPNNVFNAKDPIICGVDVVDGILKVGTPLCIPANGFLKVGKVTSIESNHQQVDRVKKGAQCAIQIVNESNPALTFGRQFTAEHMLYSELNRTSIDALKRYFKDEMTNDDWRLVIKLKKTFGVI